MANYREKVKEVDKNIEEGLDLTLTVSLPTMFPGLHREGEMSVMVSSLTYVVCADQNNNGGANSALKRRREDGGFFDISSSPIPQIKHHKVNIYII